MFAFFKCVFLSEMKANLQEHLRWQPLHLFQMKSVVIFPEEKTRPGIDIPPFLRKFEQLRFDNLSYKVVIAIR